jgi:hypothetical protein
MLTAVVSLYEDEDTCHEAAILQAGVLLHHIVDALHLPLSLKVHLSVGEHLEAGSDVLAGCAA